MDQLHTHLTQSGCHALIEYLSEEEYDTESVKQDMIDNSSNSNIQSLYNHHDQHNEHISLLQFVKHALLTNNTRDA